MSYSQLLNAYKKANKERRKKIVENWKKGATEKEYLDAIAVGGLVNIMQNSPKVVEANKKAATKVSTSGVKPTIHNVHILDASGSMRGSKLKGAIEGINTEIETLKADTEINYTQTFVHFSGSYDIQTDHMITPINKVSRVNLRDRGMTALNDAIGQTLTSLQKVVSPKDKVLVKIFTDGGENDSKKFKESQIKEMIKDLNSKNYTITFVGTAYDVDAAVDLYNIDKTNTLVHDNTGAGMRSAFASSTEATAVYAKKVIKGEDVQKGFYKKLKS